MSPYHYTLLPCDFQSVSQWAPKFINFRMNALKAAPESTSSSYELESSLSHSQWIYTLMKPVFRVALCVPRSAQEKSVPLWEREWVGILCLYGPRCVETNAEEDIIESTWYFGAGYVCPLHRGYSVMRDIFNFAIQQATKIRRKNPHKSWPSRFRTRIMIIVKSGDVEMQNYYRTGGLEITQALTLAQFSKLGWDIPISSEHLDMDILLMERTLEPEAEILPRL